MPPTAWRLIWWSGAGAALHLTTQASTVVHDGRADGSQMRQSVTVKDNAFCAMISDPYVLFPGADLHIATTATVAADAISSWRTALRCTIRIAAAGLLRDFDRHKRDGTDGKMLLSDRGIISGDEVAASCGALGGMTAAGSV